MVKPKPFVSIITVTYNRRQFIPSLIKSVLNQDYPKDRTEWIVIDDGTDKVEDLFTSIPFDIKYHYLERKLPLGQKRNFSHYKSKGDILVYMDDDDFYPPERVSHAVHTLLKYPSFLIAGSSEIHVYFNHITQLVQFGPYRSNHATAGTFAFKRKLLSITKYDDTAFFAEEKQFLKNYTIPMIQLDTLKTILCFNHLSNTFDKGELLNQKTFFQKVSEKTLDMWIKDKQLMDFYLNLY